MQKPFETPATAPDQGELDEFVESFLQEIEDPQRRARLAKSFELARLDTIQLKQRAFSGDPAAQHVLSNRYRVGTDGLSADLAEADRWLRAAAEAGYDGAQAALAEQIWYSPDAPKLAAIHWMKAAAEQGERGFQSRLANMYFMGGFTGKVPQDHAEAAKWFLRAARQGDVDAQGMIGACYFHGWGVPRDYVLAYMWLNLASAHRQDDGPLLRECEQKLSPDQIAEAQRLCRAFEPGFEWKVKSPATVSEPSALVSGTGFFITADGYFVTNSHVVGGAKSIRVRTAIGEHAAALVCEDKANDLAILKVGGTFEALPIQSSASIRMADWVATVGFPNPDLQGVTAKFSSGDVASLTGIGDDPRFLQVSLPVQSGNSGGALVNRRGEVVGVVVAQLDKAQTFAATGSLPENVNYAVKSTLLLALLESVPSVDQFPAPQGQSPLDQVEVASRLSAASAMVLVER